ncbi:MAG: hypothetical protein ACLSGP_09545 [Faecalibacterium prausnitzii]
MRLHPLEKEVTQNKVLDDGEVIQRLRTLTHLKNMDYWKISRAVWRHPP